MTHSNSTTLPISRLTLFACLASASTACDAGPQRRGQDLHDHALPAAGSDADDTLCGGAQAEILEGLGGSDRLFGGEGDDELLGGDQGDMLQGGPGHDLLEGGHGPDVLNGGPDDDDLRGGPGNDYYVIEAGHGHDVISDAGGTHDRLTFAGLSPDEVSMEQTGDDLLITVPGGSVLVEGHFSGGAIELVDHEYGQDPFTALDYGIHWFGPGNAAHKYVPTVDNPYFDPSRPTIMIAHGWQKNSITGRKRPGLNYSSNASAPDIDLADAWIAAGWNVGMFYWQNFADEGEVKDAEGKIWSPEGRNGKGMRWRSQDGKRHDWPFAFSVTDLAQGSLTAALLEANAPTVQLAGHSLGSQLVTAVGHALQTHADDGEISPRLRPERVSLLDPFWSKGKKDYFGGSHSPGSRSRALTNQLLDAGVAMDAYRSSSVTTTPFVGDANPGLFEDVCLVELRPYYFNQFQQDKKHIAALWHYMLGFDYAQTFDDLGEQVASSGAPVSVLWSCIEGGYRWNQVEGRNTKTPADDAYERIDEG